MLIPESNFPCRDVNVINDAVIMNKITNLRLYLDGIVQRWYDQFIASESKNIT